MQKRIIKLLISIGFFAGEWLWKNLRKLLGFNIPGSCVVLFYHAVSTEQKERFNKQIDILRRWAEPLTAVYENELPVGKHHAVLTFDDGFVNIIKNTLPVLAKYRIPSVLFITTNHFNSYPTWIKEANHPDRFEQIMTIAQLASLNHGLFTIGSHSVSHPFLSKLEDNLARKELIESKQILQEITGREVNLFSFPHGDHNSDLVKWSKDAGYKRVFTTAPKLAFSKAGEFVTGRFEVSPTDWDLEFRLKLLGAYRWLPLAFALKRKLLFVFKKIYSCLKR